MMRPLYLQGGNDMRVAFDEPALAVKTPDKTRQLFPLRRISRVVVTGDVDWSMPALLACADQGVSVLFIDTQGNIRGRWIGKSRSEGPLQSLFRLLSRPDAKRCYDNWHNGMQRMVARSAARRLALPEWRTMDLQLLSQWLEQSLNDDWNRVRQWLSAVVVGAVTDYLFSFGADAGSDAETDWCLRLAEDLGALLLADFYPLLFEQCQTSPEPPGQPVLLRYFESRSVRLELLLRGALSRLSDALKGRY